MKKLKSDLYVGIVFLVGIVAFVAYAITKFQPEVAPMIILRGGGVSAVFLAIYWISTLRLRK